MSESLNTQLANAVAQCAVTTDALVLASLRVSEARKEETDAINRANAAQKHFDELVVLVKKEAHRDTNWKRTKGEQA